MAKLLGVGREAASEARSEPKASGVNKEDFVLARFARGRSAQRGGVFDAAAK